MKQPIIWLTKLSFGEGEQQLKTVSVCSNRAGTGVELLHQIIDEELLQEKPEDWLRRVLFQG